MDSYPKFLQIPPVMLEKVITKCKEKSYFRLQQTCRDVHEFIKNSENICVHLSEYKFYECRKEGSSFFLTAIDMDARKYVRIPMQDVHGIRLGELRFARSFYENREEFDTLLDILEKNQIKCVKFNDRVIGWTVEQFTTVLKMLTPSKVRIITGRDDSYSSYYEEILKAKQMNEVALVLGPDDFFLLAKRFMVTFPVVKIHVLSTDNADIDAQFKYCNTILQILHTESPQNLRDFYFSTLLDCWYPTFNDMEEQFRQYNPKVQGYTLSQSCVSARVDLPESLPSNTFCEIRFDNTCATINYGKCGSDGQPATKFPMNRNRSP